MVDKVAFLALTYSDFAKPLLYKQFFNTSNLNFCSLYIHNKHDLTDNFFKPFELENKLKIATNWSAYSLVHATCILLEQALKDPLNKKFVLISNSHIPIYSFETIRKKVLEKTKPVFKILPKPQAEVNDFYNRLTFGCRGKKDFPFNQEKFVCTSQWFICGREEAQLFVEKEKQYRNFFYKGLYSYADESWFPLILKTFDIEFVDQSVCYVDWSNHTSGFMQTKLGKGARSSPLTFTKVQNSFIDVQRKNSTNLFIRKIHPETIVDENYLLSM